MSQHRPSLTLLKRNRRYTIFTQSTTDHFVRYACYTCSETTPPGRMCGFVTTSNRQREHGHLNPKALILRGVQALQGSAAREHCYHTGAERHTDACRRLRPTTCDTSPICLPSMIAHQLGTPTCQKKCMGRPVPAPKSWRAAKAGYACCCAPRTPPQVRNSRPLPLSHQASDTPAGCPRLRRPAARPLTRRSQSRRAPRRPWRRRRCGRRP